MLMFVLGLLLLFYPLAQIPNMMKRKQSTGRFFSTDNRILVAKNENMGNNLNSKNIYGFFINLIVSLFLIGFGLYLIFN